MDHPHVEVAAVSTPCPSCGAHRDDVPGWCSACGDHGRLTAAQLVDWLLPDAESLDVDVGDPDPDPLAWPDYPARRELVRDRTGHTESVLLREGVVRDGATRCVAIVWDFGFFGGSMGVVAGQRIAAGYDHARRRGLPVLLLPATGGARMQEGMASLVQMAATVAAQQDHRDAGLLQVAVLRNPTTGGPFASHLNLADVLVAEPGATIGFAGPRVAAALAGGDLPDGSHTAEGALASGLVDAVVARPDLPATVESVLAWGRPTVPSDPPRRRREPRAVAPAPDPWEAVTAARAPDRPRAGAYLAALAPSFELRGDRAGGFDPAVRVALGRVLERAVVVIALDATAPDPVGPAGYRTAWRGLRLAERLGMPVITLVDTPGADASAASEAAGVAHHIAATMARVLTVDVPTVAVVTGEGGSGGALALAVTDRVLALEHSIFTVIAPEGAATILRRPDEVADVARRLDPTADALLRLGVADEVVPEGDDPVAAAWSAVEVHLDELLRQPAAERRERRATRWRHAGR